LNGIESYLWEQIENHQADYFPLQRSLDLERKQYETAKDIDNAMILTKIKDLETRLQA